MRGNVHTVNKPNPLDSLQHVTKQKVQGEHETVQLLLLFSIWLFAREGKTKDLTTDHKGHPHLSTKGAAWFQRQAMSPV